MSSWKGFLTVVTAGVLLAVAFGFAASPTQRTTKSRTTPGFLALDDLKNLSLLESRVFRGETLSPEEKTTLEQLAAVHDGRRSRGSHLDNVGGPDDFGYVYVDNQGGDTATYNWIELRGDPQATWINDWEWTSHDDAMAVDSYPIGFSFPFYGESYTHINVCTNGHIQFASRSVQYWDICLPVETIGPAIFPLGDDLHLDYGGMTGGLDVVGYRNFGTHFVIEYDSIGHCCSEGGSWKFEAILYPNGRIKLQYNSLNFGEWWAETQTIGIQESGTGSFLQYVCDLDGHQPVNGLAIWFSQPTGVPSSVTQLQGLANGTTVSLAWYDPVTDTYGNPVILDSLQIQRDGDRTFMVAPGVQGFTQTAVGLGSHEYAVRAFHGSFGSAAARVIVSVGSSSYHENFDLTDGGWLAIQGWEWGPPSNAAPHSAPNVWGDRLSGDYLEGACDELRLAPGLAVVSADAAVEFYCWYNTEFWWDGVNFQASVDGDSTWQILEPSVHPYDIEDSGNDCFGANPHWCGMSQTWVRVVIPIGQYVGLTPSFRFMFGSDPIIVYPGFLFDDLRIWGLAAPVGVPVSGTITLDGGAGSVTEAVVRADGLGGPTVSPIAGGAYTLANVQRGQRMLTAELLRYTPASRAVLVPPGGIGGQDITLRRVPPPAPSGLSTTQDTSGQFVTLHWNASSDALVDQYRVYRKLRFETTWTPVRTAAALQATDTLPSFNAWQYSVSAVDTNVTPPALESPRSATVQVLYGAVPPSNLTAQQNFDDHIHLGWDAPGEGAPPLVLQYDDGTVESWLQISSPNGPSDFFAIRFDTPLPEGSLQYPLPLRACNIYLQGAAPLPEVWLCADQGGSPDMNSVYAQWMHVSAESVPGWLTLPVARGTELTEPGTVWLVWRQPPDTDVGVGADQTSAQPHSYCSEDGMYWTRVQAASLAGRLWIGGDSSGDIVVTGPSSGYPPEWITRRLLADPHRAELGAKAGAGSRPRGPRVSPARDDPFCAALSWPVERVVEDPYITVPGLEFEFSDRHASTLDDPNYYILYRNGVDYAHPVTTSYDNTVAEGIAYNYYVTAHYPNGSESGPTNAVTATATMPPGAPQNLTGLPLDATRIRLLWVDPTVNENGTPCTDLVSARVYRNGVLVATVPAGAGRYTDTPPFPNHLNLWAVRGIDEVPNEGPAATLLGSVIDQWLDGNYDWVDISATGMPVVSCDDCIEGPFPIGFPFTFYGNTYDSVRVTSNGYLTFMNTWSSNWNDSIPTQWEPNNAIYVFWDDLDPSAGGQVLLDTNLTDSIFVVSYLGVRHFASEDTETFQVILRPDGSVRMNYQTLTNNPNCTAAVENANGTVGLMVWYNGMRPGIDWMMESESAMDFWGMPPTYCSVSGHVTLDGGGGNVTQVTVGANGASHPTAHPAANGNYVLNSVVVGNRILTATLLNYHQDTLHCFIPDTLGLTNQNLTLRRLDPPAPTGLVAVLNTTTGRDSLHWDVSTDGLVDQYRVYRKLRDDVTWVLNRTVGPLSHNWAIDTLTVDGIYQYRVTAVDTGVTPPAVESGPSISVQVIFGEVPPERLIANGRFDSKIVLSWLPPGSSPAVEVFYDSVDVDSNCVNDGLGFNGEFPFAWFVAHYQGVGEIRIERIRTRHYPWSQPGAPVQLAVFDDDGNGAPTFIPLGVTDTVVADPTTWLDVELQTPVVIPGGSFFVGIRQVTAQRVDIGMDWCAEEHLNTFFYTTDTAQPWTTLESIGFWQVLVIRATVVGNIGGDFVELSPTPVDHPRPAASVPAAQPLTKTAVKAERGRTKQTALDTPPLLPVSARVSSPQTSLRASQAGPTAFSRPRVTWRASASGERGHRTLDEVLRYRIYRDGVRYDSVTVAMTSWENTGLIENQSHSYYVTAVYDNGQASSPSNTVSAACNMEPGAPTDLVLTAIGMTQMRIQWTDPTVNADGTPCVDLAGIRVYRDGGLVGTVAAGAGQYVDVPPDPMFFYLWEVRGYDEVPNIGPGSSQRGAVQSPWQVVEYEWLDVWDLSTPVVQCDDCSEGPFDLGFTFTFYGQTYESIHIASNGFLSFTSEAAWGGGPIPSVWEPNAAIYAFSTDLLPAAGQCRYYSDPVHERFVVTFQDCPHFGNPVMETFQIILEAEDGITLNYQMVSDPSWCLIGVENGDGTDALQLFWNNTGDFIPTSLSAVRFWGGPNSSIMGTVRAFGTNDPIPNASVWVTGQPDTMATDSLGAYEFPIDAGTYALTFHHPTYCDTVHTNVVVTEGEVTVRNAVMRAPQAQFSHTSLSISTPRGVNAQATFILSNNGGQCPLTYSISDTSDWLSASPASGQVPQNQSVTITASANVQGMSANSERHSVLVFEYNATGNPHPIPVDLFVGPDAVDPAAALPTEFAYRPNYPNPFNATTTFAFDVPKESEVRIIVFNLTGQEVAAPVTGMWPAGRHHVTFDAGKLPSGMYLVRMSAGDFHAVGKMLLLK